MPRVDKQFWRTEVCTQDFRAFTLVLRAHVTREESW